MKQVSLTRTAKGFWVFFLDKDETNDGNRKFDSVREFIESESFLSIWLQSFNNSTDTMVVQGEIPLPEGEGPGAFCLRAFDKIIGLKRAVFLEVEGGNYIFSACDGFSYGVEVTNHDDVVSAWGVVKTSQEAMLQRSYLKYGQDRAETED